MNLFKNWWPTIIGLLLMLLLASWLRAQDKQYVEFPINFSCGVAWKTDNLGTQTGWILAADIKYQTADEYSVKHFERQYQPGDDDKADAYCLELNREFTRERAAARKRLQKRKEAIKSFGVKAPETAKF